MTHETNERTPYALADGDTTNADAACFAGDGTVDFGFAGADEVSL